MRRKVNNFAATLTLCPFMCNLPHWFHNSEDILIKLSSPAHNSYKNKFLAIFLWVALKRGFLCLSAALLLIRTLDMHLWSLSSFFFTFSTSCSRLRLCRKSLFAKASHTNSPRFWQYLSTQLKPIELMSVLMGTTKIMWPIIPQSV